MGNEKAPVVVRGFFCNPSEIERSSLSFRFGSRDGHGRHFLARGALYAGSFALQIAQVIQPGTANFTFAYDFDGTDGRRLQWENTFDAVSKSHASHRKGRTGRPTHLGY